MSNEQRPPKCIAPGCAYAAIEGHMHCGRRHEKPTPSALDGPPIQWVANADAGDSTGLCSICADERDEPHSWKECAQRVTDILVGEFERGWKAAEEHALRMGQATDLGARSSASEQRGAGAIPAV